MSYFILDFVDITAVLKYKGKDKTLRDLKKWVEQAVKRKDVFPAAPFLPRYEVDQYVKDDVANYGLIGSYVMALKMRNIAHEMAAIFGARLPHSTSLIPSGCTQVVTMERILSYKARLDQLAVFVKETYIPDLVLAATAFPEYWNIGKSYNNFLSYGVFRMENNTGAKIDKFIKNGVIINGKFRELNIQKITEDVKHSRYKSQSGLHPSKGETDPAPHKGYSWLKAPRYENKPMEVGPLARLLVNYYGNNPFIRKETDNVLKQKT